MVTLGVALAQVQCRRCGFISADDELIAIATPCPNCGDAGNSRGVFPQGSAIELLNSIEHFYSIAHQLHKEAWESTAAELATVLRVHVSASRAYQGWRWLNRSYSGSVRHEKELACLQKFFRCNEETARRLFVTYLSRTRESEEMNITPILTVTLIETLLNTFLTQMIVSACKVDSQESRRRVAKLSSFESRYDKFQMLTGTLLSTATNSIAQGFWSNWEYVRQRRNAFVHRNAYALSWLASERSWHLANCAVNVFAALHNTFALKTAVNGTTPELHTV